jgi:lipopolysaccharide export system protein LptA
MMEKKAIAFLSILLALPLLFAAPKNAAGKNAIPPVGSTDPIQITADRLDMYNKQHLVVFSGNAKAVQGSQEIKADSIYLHYKKDPTGQAGARGDVRGGDLEKIEAKGSVIIMDDRRTVTGSEAVFYRGDQKIVITGNAMMREGENVVHGERITVLLEENRGIIEGAKGSRVTATVYPKESKGKTP